MKGERFFFGGEISVQLKEDDMNVKKNDCIVGHERVVLACALFFYSLLVHVKICLCLCFLCLCFVFVVFVKLLF